VTQLVDPINHIGVLSCVGTALCAGFDDAGYVVTSTDPAAGTPYWETAPIEGTGYSSTTLRLRAKTVRFGREGYERLTVTVTSRNHAAAAGGSVVIVTGARTVCVLELRKGSGSCTLTARQLARGSYRLRASYGGDSTLAPSWSAAGTLRVVS
jgi:hypothetical protein